MVKVFDTILAQHLLQPDMPHDLGFVGSVFTNKQFWKDDHHSNEALYNCRDVDGTFQIAQQLKPLLKYHGLEDLYNYTQVPLARICELMTKTGIRQDPSRVAAVRSKVLADIAETEKLLPEEMRSYELTHSIKTGKLLKKSKTIIPWGSKKVIETWLYQTLSLPVQSNAKTGRVSTDKKSLGKLYRKTHNPAIDALRRIREMRQLTTNFLSIKNTAAATVHPRFSPYGTNSGRLSSAGPNFQNQPPEARAVYVPLHPEWVLVEADFSQGENRLVAWYSKDKARLARLTKPGFSEHKWNAATFFNMKYEDVKKDNDRSAPYGMAKILTHGMGYGMGARKIAQDNELEEKFVRKLIENWKAANPLTVQWQRSTARRAETEGVLKNVFGRKRWFRTDRTYTESLAYLPQSTLADISFRALISLLYKRINWPEEKVRGVLAPLPEPAVVHCQVHDSILVSCPVQIIDNVITCIKKAMEQPHVELDGFSIPVEIKTGKPGESWGELE